jgi:hypothetical protein
MGRRNGEKEWGEGMGRRNGEKEWDRLRIK